MKKALLGTAFLFLIILSASAQRRKSIFVEGLGNGILVSGNFDIRLKPDQNDGLGFRAGIGGGTLNGNDTNGNPANLGIVTMPLSVNYIVGKKRSGFESGIGVTPIYATAEVYSDDEGFVNGSGVGVSGFLNMGYRFQPINQGIMFRANWAPAFNSAGFSASWFGVSLGYSFK